VTRLGASVFECGLVSPDAMAATLQALKRFQRAVQLHGVDPDSGGGYSAMRDARNGTVFQAIVKAETAGSWNHLRLGGRPADSSGRDGGGEAQAESRAMIGATGRVLLVDLGAEAAR